MARRIVAIAIAAVLVAEVASAQICRVTFTASNAGFVNHGSAVNVGTWNGRDVYLTAGHLSRDLSHPTASLHLDNGRVNADILGVSFSPDLAVMTIPHRGDASPFPLVRNVPGTGTEVRIIGFPDGVKTPVERRGPISGYGPSTIWVTGDVRSGDSGGAFLTTGYRTVGIIDTSNHMGRATGTDALTVQSWLASKGICLDDCSPQPLPTQPIPEPTPIAVRPSVQGEQLLPAITECSCSDMFAAIDARISVLEGRVIPPDLTSRVNAIESRLLTIEVLDKSGNVHQRYAAPLGGTIQLAPTTVQILDSDKQVISENSYPSVGGTMKFRFKPSE